MAWIKIGKTTSGTKDITSVLIYTAGDAGRRLKIGRGVLQQMGDGDVQRVDVEVDLDDKAIRVSPGQTYKVSISGRNWRSITIEKALQALGFSGPRQSFIYGVGGIEPEFELNEGSLIVWPGKKKA